MEQEPTVYLVSWNGYDSGGGVERVVGIVKRIIEKKYPVVIVDKKLIMNDPQYRRRYRSDQTLFLMVLFSSYVRRTAGKRDIIIGNGFNAPFVRKDLSIAHGCMYTFKKSINKFPWSGSTFFEMIAHRNCRQILAVSEEAKHSLMRYYGIRERKIDVINNCVDSQIFFPLMEHTEPSKTIIAFCGRLEEAKGLDVLLKLAAAIEKSTEYQLYIATPGKENNEAFYGRKNIKLQVGVSLEEMNRFYNSCDVLFMPSRFEGFEMVTLEALSAGVPVVGNYVGAIKELSDAGYDGVSVIKSSYVEQILEQLKGNAYIYKNNKEKQQSLHQQIKADFGMERYQKRIMEEIEWAFESKRC